MPVCLAHAHVIPIGKYMFDHSRRGHIAPDTCRRSSQTWGCYPFEGGRRGQRIDSEGEFEAIVVRSDVAYTRVRPLAIRSLRSVQIERFVFPPGLIFE
jgi:hypothetical protein